MPVAKEELEAVIQAVENLMEQFFLELWM
jgi:hypothetical protein